MKLYDVALITEKRYVNPPNTDPYIDNVLLEDNLVQQALEKEGMKTIRLAWCTEDFDWATCKTLLFRTPWDYSERWQAFNQWLLNTEKVTQHINTSSTIWWNIDKHYLEDLAAQNINIPPTHFIKKGTKTTLQDIHEELGWSETVLKPTISAGGRHTYRLQRNELSKMETLFSELIQQEDFMLQPFQKNILTKGEISLMICNGKFTHAIIKHAKPGDFRVQDDFGGTVQPYEANQAEIEFAENAIRVCKDVPYYGRVDAIWDNNDTLAVSELELIEPEMWYRFHPAATTDLAQALKEKLST